MNLPSIPTTWIIILNWNGLEDTLECLESLGHLEIPAQKVEILVIDNGSFQDPSATLQARYPQTKVVRLEQNIGFAAGCNYGISLAMQSQADYVVLLNNDTVVSPTFLAPLVSYCETHQGVGTISSIVCQLDKPTWATFAGARAILPLGYFKHYCFDLERHHLPSEPFNTDFVTGCCMLIPTSVIREIGALDERFFAYFEDVDFCLRARASGFDVLCSPASRIWHKESASTRRGLAEGDTSPMKHYLMVRNRIVLVKKHTGLFGYMFFLVVSNLLLMLFFLCAFLLRQRWRKMYWYLRGVVDGLQQRFENEEFFIRSFTQEK